jgi:hypothetical protein
MTMEGSIEMPCSKDQYHLTLQENLRRMNTSRDEAVRMTNVEHGYGESTALQHDVRDRVVDAPTQHDTKD